MNVSEANEVDIKQLASHHRKMFEDIWELKSQKIENIRLKEIEKAIQYCKKKGINRVILNASDAGKPLYESSGFASSPETMRLFIK